MSLNTAHLNGGVLIHNGEQILLYSDGVSIEWSGQQGNSFYGVKKGSIYLTTHRVIFLNKSSADEMLSFSFPFVTLSEVEIEQPVFGANYIKGKVRAQPNGNWIGEAKFKMTFKHGGAIEFGQALLRAAHFASRGGYDAPPPYVPPQTQWYAAAPPAYAPSAQGYYGWMPPTNVFPQHPPTDGVFMTDAPPPYPGIVPGYQPNGYGPPQGPPGYSQGPPMYPGTAVMVVRVLLEQLVFNNHHNLLVLQMPKLTKLLNQPTIIKIVDHHRVMLLHQPIMKVHPPTAKLPTRRNSKHLQAYWK
ncbi:unnamed protein product [Diabrotica balteata]|uniref:GRAM domain-containing protein n=1 Tax=Diabrotica balteata TaxID=107213 RepID=A0A9N9TE53_DIABA|nr:unnamed protein product [Diabrotica balteata]